MKQQFIEDVVDTIRLTVFQDNTAIVPSSGTITLYKQNGSVLQASASVTIDSTTGEMTYALTTTHTANRDLNFKAVWSYVVSGVTYYETQLFDVVRSILAPSISDNDIYSELEIIRTANTQSNGVASSATSTTLVDTAKRKEADKYWKGGVVSIISGTGLGQQRVVTDFVQSTSTFTVSPSWVTTPDSTSVYSCIRSFSDKILQAFRTIETELYNKGNRHQLILESSQIEMPLIYLTIHLIALDSRDQQNDKWDMLQKEYYDKYIKSFSNLVLEYDTDDSGTIEGDEKQYNLNQITISRG